MFGFSRFTVRGNSMTPTLCNGDVVIVSMHRQFTSGDIVVCKDPRTRAPIVKRIYKKTDAQYAVRGDNASESTDSRTFGLITGTDILGKVILY